MTFFLLISKGLIGRNETSVFMRACAHTSQINLNYKAEFEVLAQRNREGKWTEI